MHQPVRRSFKGARRLCGTRSIFAILNTIGLLAALVSPSHGALTNLRFSPDITVDFGSGSIIGSNKIANDNLAGTVNPLELGLPNELQITGYDLLGNGDQLLSFDVPVSLTGGIIARPGDVVRLSGGTYTLVFDSTANGIPSGAIVDGVASNGNNLLLSFDTTVTLNANALVVDDEDIVQFQGSTFSRIFDGSSEGVDPALDADGIHRLANGHLLLSFDGSGTVGGVGFDDEDVLEFTSGLPPGTGWATSLAYDGSTKHSPLNAADLHDIAVLEISTLIPTPTPTPTSTSRPGPTASPASTKQLTSCQQTILKAATKFFTTRMASLARCEVSKVKGKLGAQTDCRAETKTAAKLGKAVDKLRKDIGKKCGGDDKTCGGNLNHESGGAVLGWPAVCPTLTFGSCGGAITPNACNGIAECIECLTNAASDESIDVSFPGSPSTDKGLIKCQQTLGAAAVAFARAKASALQKCWLARLKAKPKHTNDCIPPATGDGKVIGAIAKAAAKRDKAICKACGGADKACGGSDDFKPGDIGFPATCRNVKPPGATACASGQITVLQGAVTCVGCVNEFVVDCLDLVAVPEFDAIPSDCMTK